MSASVDGWVMTSEGHDHHDVGAYEVRSPVYTWLRCLNESDNVTRYGSSFRRRQSVTSSAYYVLRLPIGSVGELAARRWTFSSWISPVALAASFVLLTACFEASPPTGSDRSNAEVDAQADDSRTPSALNKPTVEYGKTSSSMPLLDHSIPPCTRISEGDEDPCPEGLLPFVEQYAVSGSLPRYVSDVPSVARILEGLNPDSPVLIPHLVARVTVMPGTTRCERYRVILYNFVDATDFPGLFHYLCFVDVRVNEYYLGTGLEILTVAVHNERLLFGDGVVWESVRDRILDEELADPRARTAAAYEGREVVMFLRPTLTMAVESWAVDGSYDLWYVRMNSSGSARTSASGASSTETTTGEASIRTGFRYGDTVLLEMELSDLAASVRAIGASRSLAGNVGDGSGSSARSGETASSTTMRTSDALGGSAIPPLVSRSDQLSCFYIAGGADYEGDDRTTVLPPESPVRAPVATTTTQAV